MKTRIPRLITLLALVALAFSIPAISGAVTPEGKRKLVMIAGKPSHGPGDHEFNAGVKLLAKCLQGFEGLEVATVFNGWPQDESVFEHADAVFLYMDGGGGHAAIQGDNLKTLGALMDKGVSLGCAHYAVEVPADKGGPEWQKWIGGYYETNYSCNPMWSPDFKTLPVHPITRGVQPFQIADEWYMCMRFRPEMETVTGLLIAPPSDKVRDGPYVAPRGPYPHIQANKGKDEIMMWSVERPDGGRGFGFTGGHYHRNWGNDDFRKIMLNALVWISKLEVPEGGVQSTVTPEELKQNLDPKGKRGQ